MKELFTLPNLILLEDYNGNFSLYNDAVYAIFRHDFVEHQLIIILHIPEALNPKEYRI